jgi:adenylate cyclase
MAKAQSQLQTFLFADLSGYSRLSELAGDEVAAEVALSFFTAASAIATEHGAEVVKRVGDAIMLRSDSAADAVAIGMRLNAGLRDLPPIHAGVHTGVAIERDGDWWGTTVNVAARVADAADAGQVLITEATRSAAGDLGPTSLTGLGLLRMKNISSPVRIFSAAPRSAAPAAASRFDAGEPAPGRSLQLVLFDRDRMPAVPQPLGSPA